jgi:hypothetical protein
MRFQVRFTLTLRRPSHDSIRNPYSNLAYCCILGHHLQPLGCHKGDRWANGILTIVPPMYRRPASVGCVVGQDHVTLALTGLPHRPGATVDRAYDCYLREADDRCRRKAAIAERKGMKWRGIELLKGRAKMASDAIRLAVPDTGLLNPVFRRSFNSNHRADVGAMPAVRCIHGRRLTWPAIG